MFYEYFDNLYSRYVTQPCAALFGHNDSIHHRLCETNVCWMCASSLFIYLLVFQAVPLNISLTRRRLTVWCKGQVRKPRKGLWKAKTSCKA